MKEYILLFGMILLTGTIALNCGDNDRPPMGPVPCNPNEDQSIFGFEKDDMNWQIQTLAGNQAVTEVTQTTDQVCRGCGSLRLNVNLVPGDPNKNDGEALVDLSKISLAGVSAPVDMSGITITCRIFAEIGARGPDGARNFVQLFVKDSNFNTFVGDEHDILEESCFDVTAMVPAMMDTTTGFDPTDVVFVGFKIGARPGSNQPFQGFIYIDAFDW